MLFRALPYVICFLLLSPVFFRAEGKVLFLAPGGSDTNAGTINSPLFTLNQAMSLALPGDTLFFRGGVYSYTATQNLSKPGSAAARFYIFSYQNERPLLSWETWTPPSNERGAARGFYLTGDYYHIRGLDIAYAPDNGMKLEGNYNIVENCVFHHNGDSGLQVGLKSNAANDGTKVAFNLIKNCDAYRNVDPATNYENADGFACKLFPGKGNKFYGCRAWENCDDGWDLYETEYPIELEHCWTWHNGDPTVWGFTSFNGDGNGFKLGGAGVAGSHFVKNCIAFNNREQFSRGFHQNNNGSGIVVYNCTAWGNTVNYGFNDAITISIPHTLKNNIGFDFYPHPQQTGAANARLLPGTIVDKNSWEPATNVTVTREDFISLDEADAKAQREADGSLPRNGFARLRANSDVIDKGVNVGIPYLGLAPDLGAFEFNPSSAVKRTIPPVSTVDVLQNYPNPFNPVTQINFRLSVSGQITLSIFNSLGDRITTLCKETKSAGEYSVRFDAAGLAAGIYFCELRTPSERKTIKIVLLK